MEAVQGGDVAALEVLFDRHHQRMYSFLARLSGNDQVAEDIVQETFLRILQHPERYQRTGTFSTWLFRVSRNLAVDAHRRERDQELDESGASQIDDRPLALERLTTDEQHQALDEALAALPLGHREILLLRGVEGLDHHDIGVVLNCTEGAARVRLHRASAALRQVWFARNGDR